MLACFTTVDKMWNYETAVYSVNPDNKRVPRTTMYIEQYAIYSRSNYMA